MGSSVSWEKEEEKALVRAWVTASVITLDGQKACKFWSREFFEIYFELISDGKDRTSTVCTAQWVTINQDVTKFAASIQL
jgi:hypothetical protein